MKLGYAASALGIAGLASVALAWQLSASNTVAKHLPGKWMKDAVVTQHLEPDSRIAQFDRLEFTNDPSVIRRMEAIAVRVRGLNVVLSGMMKLDGNDNPYVVAQKEGTTTLIWFHPGEDSKLGDPVSRVVNLIVAKDEMHDMLFLGDENGMRGASVCFMRAK